MAKWMNRLPTVGTVDASHKFGIQIASAAEIALFTVSPIAGAVVEVPMIRPQGLDVDVNHKPVIVRIREFPSAGSGGTAIAPVAVDRRSAALTPRYAIVRLGTEASGTEGPLVYQQLMFPQSIQPDAYLDPTDGQVLAELSPGLHYRVTVEFPWWLSGVFDFYLDMLTRD